MFGTDQVLLYNVEPWSKLGFGVPNFGDNLHTVNMQAHRLADEIGQLQLYIMTHVDVLRTRPPSRNTIERLGRLMNRVRNVLAGRAKEYSELRVEPGHGSPAPKPWTIHPVPYFNGPIVRNGWLAEYNEYCMLALTNLYQHTDNTLALTITSELAGDIWQYFREVSLMLGRELLNIEESALLAPDFQFTAAHYAAYRPEEVTVRLEAIDSPVDPAIRFTEDDIQPFLRGIPANLLLPNLARYPVSGNDDFTGPLGQGTSADKLDSTAAAGTVGGSAISPVI
ncbi:MAG: hypothetical protein KDA79_19700 [Planctomycetaceae bacterium]|nr:hypothetical protein [Planctomycetaceae bacterium]